jgi:hypothetical protein
MDTPHLNSPQNIHGRAALDALIERDRLWRAAHPKKPKQPKPPRWKAAPDPTMDAFDASPAAAIIHPSKSKKQAHREARFFSKQRKKHKDSSPWRLAYEAYIRSPEWRIFRGRVLAERGKRCEDCGSGIGTMHVHHQTYKNFKAERPEDVRVLCGPCHAAIHL